MWAPGLEKQSSGLAPHYYETVELIMSHLFLLLKTPVAIYKITWSLIYSSTLQDL